jgi:hypothetical protein
MILESMLIRLRDRTHMLSKDSMLIGELNSAQDHIWNRIITNNANILKVDDKELTLAAQTSSYDLATNVSTTVTLVAVKWLGVKLTGDTKFQSVVFIDSSDDRFISADQDSAATAQPVYAAMENFNQVRFAPPLPSGAILRVDYIYGPLGLDLATNCSPDLPYLVHEAIVDKATAQVFVNLDDDRAGYWEAQSLGKLYAASNSLNRRQYAQQPRTRPSNAFRPSLLR